MKKLSKSEQKEILLELMDDIHSVCEENDIPYSLSSGSLLGAVRHRGFIPWDDDIDIVVPRKHYHYLLSKLRLKNENHIILDEQTKDYRYGFAKYCSQKTYCKSLLLEPEEFGVFIDIFPTDNIPDEQEQRDELYKKITSLKEKINYSSFRSYMMADSLIRFLRNIIFKLPKTIKYRMHKSRKEYLIELIRLNQSHSHQITKQVCYLGTEYGFKREAFNSNYYNYLIDFEFEDRVFKGFANYDTYLSNMYGNYMQIPKNKVSHEAYKWYWKD